MTDVSDAAKKQKQNLRDDLARIEKNKEEALKKIKEESKKKKQNLRDGFAKIEKNMG